jgi:ABC-type glycerol-3-phosphate transport system substrate-binding protein
MMKGARPLLLLALAAVLSGCGLLQKRLVTLCTDRPEMAAYVEYFNTLPLDCRVELYYQSDPVQSLLQKGPSGQRVDLVLGRWLNGTAATRNLSSLDSLFRRNRLRREEFYQPLLAAGVHDRRQLLLPFSFNLPAVVFSTGELTQDVPNLTVTLDYLKAKGAQFNQAVRSSLVRMGFSPTWSEEFLYGAAALLGAGFREGSEGQLRWDSAGLSQARSYLQEWVTEANGGLEQDTAFRDKYLTAPLPRLLEDGRILFYPTDSGQLYEQLPAQGEEPAFRWLVGADGAEGQIQVQDDMLYFGIPKGSRRKRDARLFLAWIFLPETQARLLEIGRQKRLKSFGLAGGLSALRAVSEREFPQYYRFLLGRLPPEQMLRAPTPKPASWGELKSQVLLPWLAGYVSGDQGEASLSERLKSYRAGKP